MRSTRARVLMSLVAVCSLALVAAGGHAQEADSADMPTELRDIFYPYREVTPQVEGITPGMTISKDNAQVAETVLPPEILRVVQAGDFEIRVQETTDTPLFAGYVAASARNVGQVQLGADGRLENYTSGQPFPVLDVSDPQAGVKAAWNYRYRYMGDSLMTQGVLRSINSSGRVERSVDTDYARLYGMHRLDPADNVEKWQKEGTWWREHSVVLQPQDLEGAQSLSFHYDDDSTERKVWAYDPKSRRTRSIASNVLETSFGLNFLIEDHAGFQGYIRDHSWNYLGEQVVLIPGIVKGQAPEDFGGKGNWYPQIPWELRRVHVVEATPSDPNHPYGKRRLYIDRQLYAVFYSLIYDREGQHWRTLFHLLGYSAFHPDNTDVPGISVHLGNLCVDYQNDVASLWTGKVLINKPVKPRRFTVKEMIRRGK